MRTLIILALLASLTGCTRVALDRHLDEAYKHYEEGDCDQALLDLSRAERNSRSRNYVQPEISLLRGQCLERQNLFVDAARTYEFIVARYPASEYAYRARARLETLQQLNHLRSREVAKSSPAPL
ncbi:tetratricopeptide repeat protein [Aquipseudomonas ullengensis]|uniref:Tetratricopeptide repeat protein n=1 Tax=Aquipseudomonas ullengensis TaxID=2759166 RepID=A0A7W4LKB5_9GAMM|nr:tetratricopeptide repeat protein [Pseudomonas ullengensis]MBB2494754.1 tetratricopeptide repeat protein [Pseudomonas ullengensis]